MYRRYIIFDFEYSKRHTLAQDFSPCAACLHANGERCAVVPGWQRKRMIDMAFFDGLWALCQAAREDRTGVQAAR